MVVEGDRYGNGRDWAREEDDKDGEEEGGGAIMDLASVAGNGNSDGGWDGVRFPPSFK